MFFMQLIFFASILLIICEAKKQAHWTDFVPNRNSENENHIATPQPNDSNNSLNLKSKANRLLGDQIRDDIPAGHTNRGSLIPLIVQRDKQEEKVNHALIGGIIARKLEHKASHCLFNCAFEERAKSQQLRKQINQVKSEGHIDRNVERAMLRLRRHRPQAMYERTERYKRKLDTLYKPSQRNISDGAKKYREDQEKRKFDRYRQLERRKRQ